MYEGRPAAMSKPPKRIGPEGMKLPQAQGKRRLNAGINAAPIKGGGALEELISELEGRAGRETNLT